MSVAILISGTYNHWRWNHMLNHYIERSTNDPFKPGNRSKGEKAKNKRYRWSK